MRRRDLGQATPDTLPKPVTVRRVSADPIVEAMTSFHTTAAMKAAIELGLFTAIGEGAHSPAGIASTSGASQRGVRIVCDFLAAHGLLAKTNDRYALTPSSSIYLDRRFATYMGDVIDFMCSPEIVALLLDDPAEYVRNGGSKDLGNATLQSPLWGKFADAMKPFASPVAKRVAATVASWEVPPRKVLDIAAGHGLFGIEVAKALPEAEIVAVDFGRVLAIAQHNATKASVASRYAMIAGSAFEVEWGAGYDLVLLPNFLHHFDIETCTSLLQRVRRSLSHNGRSLAIEFVADADPDLTAFMADFAFVMLATTPGGDALTMKALDTMARAAGFQGISVDLIQPTPASLVEFER